MTKDPKLEATKILDKLGYNLPVDVEKVAEMFNINIVGKPLEDNISGMLVMENNGATIGINQSQHPNRQRFSIAHELGHYLMHYADSSVYVDSAVFYRDNKSSGSKKEIEANNFAAELLMPEKIIKEKIKDYPSERIDVSFLQNLANELGVSIEALMIRLTKLDLIHA